MSKMAEHIGNVFLRIFLFATINMLSICKQINACRMKWVNYVLLKCSSEKKHPQCSQYIISLKAFFIQKYLSKDIRLFSGIFRILPQTINRSLGYASTSCYCSCALSTPLLRKHERTYTIWTHMHKKCSHIQSATLESTDAWHCIPQTLLSCVG